MTQEEKELLLTDLCARLPYDVKVRRYVYTTPVDSIQSVELFDPTWLEELYAEEAEFKPYLFPLSSMTKEQKKDIFCNGTFFISNRNELGRFPKHSDDYDYVTIDDYLMIYKKLIKNHFDVNGLIPKGLAIDATGLNIY